MLPAVHTELVKPAEAFSCFGHLVQSTAWLGERSAPGSSIWAQAGGRVLKKLRALSFESDFLPAICSCSPSVHLRCNCNCSPGKKGQLACT